MRAPRPARSRRALRLITWLLRAVLVAVILQFSGVAHYLTDAVQVFEGAALHQGTESCPYEDAGDDCFGCPDCHCVHIGCIVPPSVAVPLAYDSGIALSLPYSSTGPPRGDLLSVFRPPRHLA